MIRNDIYRLSIVIVTYNSESHIYDCLKSIFFYNDIGEELEVIIVDNCSDDFLRMKKKIESLYGNKVRIIENTINGGYGQGNNVGIKASNAPYIMIMNPDVRLVMPVFSKCLSVMEHNPKMGLLGYTQRNVEGSIGRSTSWLSTINPYVSEPLRYITGKLNLFFPKFMFFTGASFFIRKEVFLQIGLFDENIFMYSEEEDIHDRMIKNGWKVKYLKALSYQHLHHHVSDYREESTNWLKNSLKTTLYLGEKRGEDKKSVIKREIKRTKCILFIENLRKLAGKGTLSKTNYFKHWLDYLHSMA